MINGEETGNLQVREMADWKFNRRLDDNFVNHLNTLYNSGESWWKDLMDDSTVFLAIRDNYLNFYYRGCSLLKLKWRPRAKEVIGEIHYKYLLQPSMKPPYVSIVDGRPKFKKGTDNMFLDYTNVEKLKKSVKRYAGAEKSGVHDIIRNPKNYNVLDVEITFSDGSGTRRIDMATLRLTNDSPVLKFFEAKHFKNGELRTKNDQDPDVVNQLKKYKRLLNKHKPDIINSYIEVCRDLVKLNGFKKKNESLYFQLESVNRNSKQLSIDVKPKLIVYGFDKDQRDGSWKAHRCKLTNILGSNRVICRGSAKTVDLN